MTAARERDATVGAIGRDSTARAVPDRRVLGAMTGTSLDGVDVAAVRVTGAGPTLQASVVDHDTGSLEDVAGPLTALARGEAVTADAIAAAAEGLGHAHVEPLQRIVARVGRPDLVVVHGQTVLHRGGRTWQLIDPWPIATALQCAVLHDLRRADIAAGGAGAPITPLADWVLLRDPRRSRVVVNLGGFCNVTELPAGGPVGDVRGGDVCACNHVLNEGARRLLDRPYDDAGAAAAAGRVDDRLRDRLLVRLREQVASGRSLGSGDELHDWLDPTPPGLESLDALASAADAVGTAIGETLVARREEAGGRGAHPVDVALAGGGRHHAPLRAAIGRALAGAGMPPPVDLDAWGVPAVAREAASMAVLGALAADGVAPTLPAVTGRGEPVAWAGTWTNLPAPHPFPRIAGTS